MTDGQARQLTNDGKSKHQAVLSPSANQIAYYEECPVSEHCTPSVVILDLQGRHLRTFHAMSQTGSSPDPCMSILDIFWVTETSIATDCHLNPSMSEYIETDLASGKTVRDLLGLAFTPSPDRKYVAHIGPIMHFAPPFAQSYYLYIDKTVVYPLPKGMRPSEKQPDVVRQTGSTWTGIHGFVPEFSWSPDSERVAFVDCLFDWVQKGIGVDGATPIGDETGRGCFVAVVARTGRSWLFPIGAGFALDRNAVNFSWYDPNHLSVQIAGKSTTFTIPKELRR